MKYILNFISISSVSLLLSLSYAFPKIVYASTILDLLHISPQNESIDYVKDKKQFQLQKLLTEQRHPQTNNLSYQINNNTQAGLTSLFTVDQDISKKFTEMANNPQELNILSNASQAIEKAIINHRKVFFYGTGATGRLSVLVESSLWRPYWEKLKPLPVWKKIKLHQPDIENAIVGIITGGDLALVNSLPGFEDLQVIGKLQLQEQHIKKGDAVFAITEGGETSAVIGSILSAEQLNTSIRRKNLYFIYNNPNQTLWNLLRSRSVLQNPNIIKINLATGPQAITGSTRMQATSSELYLVGILLEDALQHILQKYLSKEEQQQIGFSKKMTLKNRLLYFKTLQNTCYQAADKIAPWTDLEAKTYATHHISIYFANQALLSVFTDVTERAPTFRLEPLDTTKTKKSWIYIWAPTDNQQQAWRILLHRHFRGLEYNYYLKDFMHIQDPYLKKSALQGLKEAGNKQQFLYDFSFSKQNREKLSPYNGDLAVLVLFSEEQVNDPQFYNYLQFLKKSGLKLVILAISTKKSTTQQLLISQQIDKLAALYIPITVVKDPLGLNQQLVLKMLLNTHSTAVMAKLGRVVGNTMTNVNPSNLKLIGRATYLIQIQVNATIKNQDWIKEYGVMSPISYAEANAILFNAIDYMKSRPGSGHTSEVALSIIRVLESLKQQRNIPWQQAEEILHAKSLGSYLSPYKN